MSEEKVHPIKVFINTYNRLSYLKLCVKGFYMGTHLPFEPIVLDSGSTDGTHEWLESKGIEYRVYDGLGNCNTRNIAMEEVDDWCVFINDDSFPFRGWDIVTKHAMKRDDIGLLCLSHPRVYTPPIGTIHTADGINYSLCEQKSHNMNFSAIKKSLWEAAGKFQYQRLPEERRWGYWANYFVWKVRRRTKTTMKIAMTNPSFGYIMEKADSFVKEPFEDYREGIRPIKIGANTRPPEETEALYDYVLTEDL